MLTGIKPERGFVYALLRNVIFWCGGGVFALVFISGCGDFFASKPTELESQKTLRELSRVKPATGADIEVAPVYKEPPRIVEGTIGDKTDAKLFYFSRYHTVDKLAGLINNQFIKKFFNAKGKSIQVVDYNVSTNPATNQLIVRCPTVVDAEQVLVFLEKIDVPPVQVKIDCIISEVYADHTLDWETHLEIQNLFGAEINLIGKLPGAALRDIARSTFGLKTGYVEGGTYDSATGGFNVTDQGHMFGALVDVLESRGYLKILMNPQLEVINGESATIVISEHVPLDEIQNVHPVSGVITQRIEYVDVVDSLTITPHVFADGYIGIETKAVIGSKSTPEGVKQIPIVTKREVVVKENRIRHGESLVIGGIRKTEQRSVVRGIPFFKDIPLLGVLFSSKDFEERGKEVLFILTPTISTGGVANEKMVAEIQRKHSRIKVGDSLIDSIKDPFGAKAYTELVEEEAIGAEVERIKAEMDKAAAERKVMDLTERLERAAKEVEEAKKRTATVKSRIETEVREATTDAESAVAEAEKAKAEAEAAKAAAEKAKQDAEAQIQAWMKAAKERKQQIQAAETEAKKKNDGSRTEP
ncbi:MAG: hypothetical protein DRP66_08270 [Planctomycetota bacterium]|nr:MAG: hypothetical protein DRP66_08270 [Planctomycetota bacterium]